MAPDDIARRFENVKEAADGQWTARCPVHDDKQNSLSIGVGDDDRVLLHCHAGCATADVLRAVGLRGRDLFNRNEGGKVKPTSAPNGKIVSTYDYRDADGNLVYQAVRLDPKSFRQRRPDGNGGWKWDMRGVKRVPYRLPELTSADVTQTVFIVEGEKDVDRLCQLGFVATCNVGGAGKWKSEYSQHLRDRHVVILPDNDSAGRQHAQQVATLIIDDAASVRIVKLPELLEKGDVSDWLDNGGTIERLRQLVEAAPEWSPSEESITPNEGVDDPHRLSRLYVATEALTPEGDLTLRYWRDEWHRWDGNAYRVIATPEMRADVSRLIKCEFDRDNLEKLAQAERKPPTCRKVTVSVVTNTMNALASETILPGAIAQPCWLVDTPPFPPDETLVTQSGLVHLPSLMAGKPSQLPPTPHLFSGNVLPCRFDPEATCPQWLEFLSSMWPDDRGCISSLQEWFGYSLLPDTRQQKVLMLIGPPRSGKGTIGRVLRGLIGEHNLAAPTLFSLAGPFGMWPLVGKLVALISDARLSGRMDAIAVVERLLAISGEDPVDVHRKNMPTLSGIRLPVRFLVMTNELPNMRDASGALATRVILLRLTRSFVGQEDKTLGKRLLTELSGLLTWSIHGWARLNQRGYFEQPESGRELLTDLEDLASPIGAFVRDECIVGPEFAVAIDDIYQTWKTWCQSHGRDHHGTRETFGKDLRAALPQIRRTQPRRPSGRRENSYEGIGLRESGTGWHACKSYVRDTF